LITPINLSIIAKKIMDSNHYFHLFANGDDAKSFISSEEDYVFQFNLVGVCAFLSGIQVLAFSLEESHPHFLLYGTFEQCREFIRRYRRATLTHIGMTRNSSSDVVLDFETLTIKDEDYLRNVAAYVVIQSTKDGKQTMYYDYKWGTGSMYFRTGVHIPLWLINGGDGGRGGDGLRFFEAVRFGDLTRREKQAMSSNVKLPQEWLTVNGLILPENYVNVKMYEKIFRTHNCFRVFTGAGRNQIQSVLSTMSDVRGITMEDLEARQKCREMSKRLFGVYDTRLLDLKSRLVLAEALKKEYKISRRQLATLCRLPKSEIDKYLW